MSAARKCDRCKKLFEPNILYNGRQPTFAYHYVSVTVETLDKVLERLYNHDLCPECYEELRKWMEMEEDKDIC